MLIKSQSEVRLHTGCSVHFHPSQFTRPSFSIFLRVWFRDYPYRVWWCCQSQTDAVFSCPDRSVQWCGRSPPASPHYPAQAADENKRKHEGKWEESTDKVGFKCARYFYHISAKDKKRWEYPQLKLNTKTIIGFVRLSISLSVMERH